MRRPWLLVAVAAVLADCAFPPVDAGFLAWVALAPLMLAVTSADRPRAAFWRGYVFGAAHWGVVIYWIGTTVVAWTGSSVGWLAWVGLTAIMSCWFGLFAVLAWWIARRSSGAWRVLALAAAWTLVEWLRAQTGLSMPWALIGYTQYRYLPLIQICDLSGVWGVSFLVALGNAALLDTVSRFAARARRPLASLAVFAVAGILALAYWAAFAPWSYEDRGSAFVALMQPNTRTGRGIARTAATDAEVYLRLARQVAPAKPGLIVWPESAAENAAGDPAERRVFAEIAKMTRAYQLVGTGFEDAQGRFYNSAVLFSPDGEVMNRYDKRHLVPFGEWTPAATLLSRFDRTFHFVADTTPGTDDVPLDAGFMDLGPLICYESIFPELTRAAALKGANLLVNVTNDSWSGGLPEEQEHAAMTVFRAVETRRCVAIAALTGVTGWVSWDGTLTALPPWREGAMVAELRVPVVPEPTLYVRMGDWFIVVCAVVVIGGIVKRRRPSC